MFQLQKRLTDVLEFLITDDGLLLIEGKNEDFKMLLDGRSINGVIKSPNPVFIPYEGCVYYSESNGKCFKIDLATGKAVPVSDDKHIAVRCNQESAFLIDTKTINIYSEIIDINAVKTLMKFDKLVTYSYFPSNFYCTYFNNYHQLLCFEKDSFELLWTLDVSETGSWINKEKQSLKGEIVSIIGMWNELLLLHVTQNKILAINSKGMVEWAIDNFLLPEEQVYFPSGSMDHMRSTVRWLLNERLGKLYLLGSRFLFEFDLQSQKRTILKDYSKERTWFFKEGQLKDNYISFAAYKTGGWPNYIGLFDLLKNEVVWDYKIEGDGFFVTHPVMHGDKLYVKDDKSILHVFNKE